MTEAAAANSGTAADAGAAAAASAATTQAAATQAWYPDTAKDYVANKGWKAPADLLTSYQGLETLVGADKAGRTIVLPKDDKDVEGQKAFRAKLGVPDSADQYELQAPPGEGGPNLIKEASAWFHKAGVPKQAAQEIVQAWNTHIEGLVKQAETAAQTESATQLEKLKGEWGKDFETNAEHARRFLKAAGWDDVKMAKYEHAFGTAAMLKDFHAWGSKVGEPGFATGTESPSFTATKAAVQQKIKDLTSQRIAGQITQNEFMTQMAILGPQSEAAA